MRAGVRAARPAAGARGGVELEHRVVQGRVRRLEEVRRRRPESRTLVELGRRAGRRRGRACSASRFCGPRSLGTPHGSGQGPVTPDPSGSRGSPLSRLRRGSTYRRRQLARRTARRLCLGRAHPADRGRARAWRPQSPRVPESAAAGTAGRATPSPGQRVSRFGRPHCCEVRPNQDHDHAVGLGRRGCPGRCARSSHRRPNPAPTGTPGADAATTSRRFSAHSGGTAVVRPTGFEGATAPPPAIATSQFVRSPIHAPDVCVMR